jgi:hypothetical protein
MLLALLAGCGQSSAPVEPAAKATELRDAVQAPLDKARAVEQTLQEDADNTRKAVEDAGG